MTETQALPPKHLKRGAKKHGDRVREIAARLKFQRRRSGLSVNKIADQLGVPSGRYRSWEKCFGPTNEKQYLSEVAKILGVPEAWLADGLGDPPDGNTDFEASHKEGPNGLVARSAMGLRAKDRRVKMGLLRKEVAAALGVDTAQIEFWESRHLPVFVRGEESLWETVLDVPPGWLRNLGMAAPLYVAPVVKAVPVVGNSCVDEIRLAAVWLCRPRVADRTTNIDCLNDKERRLVDIFATRYGARGENYGTLQATGEQFNLTRERVRQLVEKMISRSDRLDILTPNIDLFSQKIKPMLPAKVSQIDAEMRTLLGESLSAIGLDRFSREVLGRNVISILSSPNNIYADGSHVAVNPGEHDAETSRAVRDISFRVIRNCGAANAALVASMVGESLGRGILQASVISAAQLIDGFAWVSEEDGWYWFGPDRKENRILGVTRKIMAVAEQNTDAEEIMGGVARFRRPHCDELRHKAPALDIPVPILAALLKQVPWLKVIQSNDFRLAEAVSLEDTLSETEMEIYRLAKLCGGVFARHTLNKALIDTGKVVPVSLNTCLATTPIIKQLDRGVYVLRGAKIDPESFARACAAVGGDGRKCHMESTCADDEGFFHLRVELTANMQKTKAWDVPVAFGSKMSDGTYTVEGFDVPCNLTKFENGCVRLREFVDKLLSQGMPVGDTVLVMLNPKTRNIRLSA